MNTKSIQIYKTKVRNERKKKKKTIEKRKRNTQTNEQTKNRQARKSVVTSAAVDITERMAEPGRIIYKTKCMYI